MEASARHHPLPILFSSQNPSSSQPDAEKIKRRLLHKGVFPTPKIIRTLQKKETLKLNRRLKRLASDETPICESQKRELEEESNFQKIVREYRAVKKALECGQKDGVLAIGMPWEGAKGVELRGISSGSGEYGGETVRKEGLVELRQMIEERKWEDLRWVLEEDGGDLGEGSMHLEEFRKAEKFLARKRGRDDDDAIRLLIKRLGSSNLSMQDWKFSRLMNQSGIQFIERHLLKIIDGLGALGHWRHALSVVEWVYNGNNYKCYKSRFVYTKLLAVLGKARRPSEALHIFDIMRGDRQIYPDMPAYHSIAVTLGQAGLVKELLNTIECMRQKPSKKIKNMNRKTWDPCLEPDVIIFNAVLNACVPSKQWKGAFWVLDQMRHSSLKPTEATYGLVMEVMLRSGKYDLVHKFFGKMRKRGLASKAITYKVLVRAFWEEGKVDEAVEAVKDMEQRGVVGTASVYYELACCLGYHGRWQEAIVQAEKLKNVPRTKPLEVAFTGMIQSCMDGGHMCDCISIFEHMKECCTPNIGTINAMLKVYGRNDMFTKAMELFEKINRTNRGHETSLGGGKPLAPDVYSYLSMLEASARAHQWEYFEHIYKGMALCGFQINQNKHAWLLAEASRAGKWHLLEHAFDAILEAGEIPHLSLFTEMICRNIAQRNYERVAALINGMAHTSLRVSERQWADIFNRNQDRFGKDELCQLLEFLHGCNTMAEAIISNLLRSLECLCKSNFRKDSFGDNDGSISDPISRTMKCHLTDAMDGHDSYTSRRLLDDYGDDEQSIFSTYPSDESDEYDGHHKQSIFHVYHADGSDENGGDHELRFKSVPHISNKSQISGSHDYLRDVESGSYAGHINDCDLGSILGDSQNTATDTAIDFVIGHTDESDGSKLPSALEILDAWREKRKDDVLSF